MSFSSTEYVYSMLGNNFTLDNDAQITELTVSLMISTLPIIHYIYPIMQFSFYYYWEHQKEYTWFAGVSLCNCVQVQQKLENLNFSKF